MFHSLNFYLRHAFCSQITTPNPQPSSLTIEKSLQNPNPSNWYLYCTHFCQAPKPFQIAQEWWSSKILDLDKLIGMSQ